MSITSHAGKFSAPPTDAAGRIPLIGLNIEEMKQALAAHGLPAFRAKQVWHWIYSAAYATLTPWPTSRRI